MSIVKCPFYDLILAKMDGKDLIKKMDGLIISDNNC